VGCAITSGDLEERWPLLVWGGGRVDYESFWAKRRGREGEKGRPAGSNLEKCPDSRPCYGSGNEGKGSLGRTRCFRRTGSDDSRKSRGINTRKVQRESKIKGRRGRKKSKRAMLNFTPAHKNPQTSVGSDSSGVPIGSSEKPYGKPYREKGIKRAKGKRFIWARCSFSPLSARKIPDQRGEKGV